MKSESEKMRPFSHLAGTSTLLPGTLLIIQAFPALLLLKDLDKTISIQWKLPEVMENFTIFQDLERGAVEVSGTLGEDFLRYLLSASDGKLRLFIEKAPKEGVEISMTSSFLPPKKVTVFSKQEERFPISSTYVPPKGEERILLGSHKKQEIDLVWRRKDLREILPLWFLLSQWFTPSNDRREGMALFLSRIEEKISKRDRLGVEKDLKLLCSTAFSSLLVPRLEDLDHGGAFEDLIVSKEASSLVLLKQGGEMIRSLFLQQEKEKIHLLPSLPPSLVSGNLVQMDLGSFGRLDLEWRAGLPRKMQFFSKTKGEILFLFPREIRSFRVKASKKEKGKRIKIGIPLAVEEETIYFLDRFEK